MLARYENGIFGGLLSSIQKLQEAKYITDEVEKSLASLNVKKIKSTINFEDLFSNLGDSKSSLIQFAQGIKDGSIQLKEGQGLLQGYQEYLKSTTKSLILTDLKTKALSTSMKMLSTIEWMLLIAAASWAIGQCVKAFDNYIHRLDNAKDALADIQSELDSLQSDIQETTKRIDALEKLDPSSLSITDKEDLKRLKEQNEELAIRQKYLEMQEQDKLNEVADYTKEKYRKTYHHEVTREDIDSFKELYAESAEPQPASAYLTGGSGTASTMPYAAAQQQNAYEKESSSLANLIAQYEYYSEAKKDAMFKGNSAVVERNEQKLSAIKEKLIESRTELQGYFDDLSPAGASKELEEIKNNLKFIDETLLSPRKNLVDFLNTNILTEDKEKLISLVDSSQLTEEAFKTNFAEIDKYLAENNQTFEDLTFTVKLYRDELANFAGTSFPDIFALQDAENNATALSKLKDQLAEAENAYRTCLSAKEEYDAQGYLSIDTLQKIIGLGDEYLQYLFDEEGNVRLDTEAFRELTLARINSLEAQALNNLAQQINQINDEAAAVEYLAGKQNELASSYDNVACTALLALSSVSGFSDSEPLQEAYSAFETQYRQIRELFAKSRKGIADSYGNNPPSDAPKSTKSSSDPLKDAFTKEYNLLKHNREMEHITEKEYLDSLDALNKKYFAQKSDYLDDYRKYEEEIYKGLHAYYKDYADKHIDVLDAKLDACVINYKVYTATAKSLIENLYQEGKISAEDYYSYVERMLNKQKEIYDHALSAVTDCLDLEIDKIQDVIDAVEKQNDALNEQKESMENAAQAVIDYYQSLIDGKQANIDGLEKENEKISEQLSNYDKILSAVDRVYEAQQDALKEQQDALQDKIDLLNDENSALDLQYRKEQALYELQRSLDQRTKKVFVEGQGFLYKQDTDAVHENQKNLADIQNEELIGKLEEEKDALQESIDVLQEYRDLWSEIADAWDKLQSNTLLKDMYGENASSIILQNRKEDIEDFKNKYLNANQQINDNEELVKSIEEKIAQYEKEQAAWETLTGVITENVNQQAASQEFGADWEKQIQEGRLISFEAFKETYLAIDAQINDNSALIASYNEKISYYENLKTQWGNISSAYEDSVNRQYAAMLLGQNWEADVLSGRISTLEGFKSEYIAIQQQLADAAWASANEQIKAMQEAQKAANGSVGSAGNISGDNTQSSSPEKRYRVVNTSYQPPAIVKSGLDSMEKAQAFVESKPGTLQRALRIESYKDGGMLSENPDNTISPLSNALARTAGEDHIAPIAFRNGERVLSARQNQNFEEFVHNLPKLTPAIKLAGLQNIPFCSAVSGTQDINVVQNINVTLPNITNEAGYKNFEREMGRLKLDALQYANRRHL